MSATSTLPTTSDATFTDDVLRSSTPVLVDFTASWCGPCKLMTPVLQQINAEHDGVRIVALDVDANPATARAYGIMSMPTMILFRDGQILTKVVGAKPRNALLRDLEPHLTPGGPGA